jgi:excisionase family DNA binding protein
MNSATTNGRLTLTLDLSDEQIDAIAVVVASRLNTTQRQAPWLDTTEAARYLGFGEADLKKGRSRVHDLAAAGKLETTHDGRRLLIRRESIDSYLSEQ